MAFPDDLLSVTVEAALGADLTADPSTWEWTDIGALGEGVYDDGDLVLDDGDPVTDGGWGRLLDQELQIRRGRADESSRTQPANVSFTLDNPDGWLTPKNPQSPYFGRWARGVPVRITVEGQVRFFGQVAELAMSWPHGDIESEVSPGESRVQVTAAGVLRRLGQGQKPLLSALRRAIPTYEPFGYWPLEDLEGSTRAMSLVSSRPSAVVKDVDFASVDGPAGSDRLPDVRGFVDARMPKSAGFGFPVVLSPSVTVLYQAETAPSSYQVVLEGFTSAANAARFTLELQSGNARFRIYDTAGTMTVNSTVGLGADVFEGWQWLQIRFTDASAWDIAWWNVGGLGGGWGDAADVPAVGINRVILRGGEGWSFGHLVVFGNNGPTSAELPADGWRGEQAHTRLVRLAGESDVSVAVEGKSGYPTTQLGSQQIRSLLEEFHAIAEADGGMLREDVESFGLIYRARIALYNRPVLAFDAASDEIANPFLPVDDDQRLRNDVTVTRENGSTGTAVDSGSVDEVGIYDESVTLNLAYDHQVNQHAGWKLHLGTWPGLRYPSVTVDLALAPSWIESVDQITEGDRIKITGLPSQHPAGTVDLLIEGITETIGPVTWQLEFTCSPAGPWEVMVLEDGTLGRGDTAGCELEVAVDEDATSFSLVTTIGPVWIDSASFPAEFPFDCAVHGEIVRVTAITGTASPQTAVVERSINGVRKMHDAGSPVVLAHPAVLAL